MARDVETYLQELKTALVSAGADPALIQDALFDAEEYLQAELAAGKQGGGGGAGSPSEYDYAARFAAVVEGYGTPGEVAAAYLGGSPAPTGEPVVAVGPAPAPTGPAPQAHTPLRGQPAAGPAKRRCAVCGTEARPDQAFCAKCGTRIGVAPPAPAPIPPTQPSGEYPGAGSTPPWAGHPQPDRVPAGVQYGMQAAGTGDAAEPPSAWRQIFGPFADGRVWTALVYMILSLITGITYFTIVVTGLSTAGGMLVLIVGIPLFMLVLAIVRGLALVEGRIVEALLGTRMPRRGRSTPPNLGFWNRMLWWLKDGRTWASMAYMLLMLPLGTAYFVIAVVGLSVGLSLATSPIWGWFTWAYGDHTVIINGATYNVWPLWAIPIAFVVGVLFLIGFMHLVKWIGRGHAAFAKAMLVRLK